MLSVASAQKVIDESPFGPWWGFVVTEVGDDNAQALLPQRPELMRPGGVLQGGCAMTLADVTFWIALLARFGVTDSAVTQQMSTSFLGPPRTDLRCKARLVKTGRRIVYGEASTIGTDELLVAHHTVTYLRS